MTMKAVVNREWWEKQTIKQVGILLIKINNKSTPLKVIIKCSNNNYLITLSLITTIIASLRGQYNIKAINTVMISGKIVRICANTSIGLLLRYRMLKI